MFDDLFKCYTSSDASIRTPGDVDVTTTLQPTAGMCGQRCYNNKCFRSCTKPAGHGGFLLLRSSPTGLVVR